KTFEDFQKKINFVKNQLLGFLETRQDQKIVGYGASATSTTLISHFQLNQYFTYLVDDNPSKIGTYSPGYHIPVFGFSRLIDDPPDLIVILAWRFKDQILEKLADIQSLVVLPLPEFKIVKP
ncbi:MAG TPA: methyltransferase, partial [Flavobacteriales bacterium]|nr:methyltransferase [Flavobacteriales bacterium]